MYENYSFVLHFTELDTEEQERKIDRAIQFDYENGEYSKKTYPDVQDAQNDEDIREKERQYIEQHFPMYF